MNTCFIFGALPCEIKEKPVGDDYVIAADKGFLCCKANGITPDLVIGDFDSLGSIPDGENTEVHPKRKDDTDSMLALKAGMEKGYKRFIFYGCIGGLTDHTIANIQLTVFAAKNGAAAYMYDENRCITSLYNSSIVFIEDCKGRISVFALDGTAYDVTESGLSYEIENATIHGDFPLGVSNEFTGKQAQITVKNGTLTLIFDGTASQTEVKYEKHKY